VIFARFRLTEATSRVQLMLRQSYREVNNFTHKAARLRKPEVALSNRPRKRRDSPFQHQHQVLLVPSQQWPSCNSPSHP
jgi:hypothetical protein